MIGVYDSGLGGLTVLSALRAAGITDDAVYFADQAHVPYGDKSDAELHALLEMNLGWLEAHGVDVVAMGCNTSCAVASRLGWPANAFRFPVQDLIANAARGLAAAGYRRVGVVATAATVRSRAYGRAIAARVADAEIAEIAAPALVPLVEAGETDGARAAEAVAEVVRRLPAGIDALVYGCTHYPMLDAHFAERLPGVARVDPAVEQARAVAALGLPSGSGATVYVTNGDPVRFEAAVRRWTGDARGEVRALQQR